MRVLFIHQNFPGQYLHLARRLKDEGHTVAGLGETKNIRNRGVVKGVMTIGYPTPKEAGEKTHHYLQSTEAAVRRGQAVARSLLQLKKKGFTPDVISAHPGWGEALFVRDVFPATPVLMFCEYYFRAGEAEFAFDPEFPPPEDGSYSVHIRNTPQVMSLITANARLAPTQWQASRYPDFLRQGMSVIHDGIDTGFMRPDLSETLTVQPLSEPGESRVLETPAPPGQTGTGEGAAPEKPPLTFTRDDKVVTFVARNLEPCRGFHMFVRALPEVMRRHPDAHALIVGHDDTSYSPAPPDGETYKSRYLAEVKGRLDLSRIHFLGRVPYRSLRSLFRISSAHVYLTYPFVLSWSVLEAMACECLIVASDTPPVREVAADNENALLTDFFDTGELVRRLDFALTKPEGLTALRTAARERVLERYALDRCLEAQTELLAALASGAYPTPR